MVRPDADVTVADTLLLQILLAILRCPPVFDANLLKELLGACSALLNIFDDDAPRVVRHHELMQSVTERVPIFVLHVEEVSEHVQVALSTQLF